MRTLSLYLPLFVLVGCPRTVEDSGNATAADNRVPTANAGADQTQPADATVTLTGAASVDPDGDALTYGWRFDHVPEGSQLTSREAPFSRNGDAAAITTTFQPDVVGTYVVALSVTDARNGTSQPDYVIITAEAAENIPMANAGADQAVVAGTSATLNGAASYDPLGRSLTYAWTLVSKPATSTATGVSDATAVAPTLATDVKGAYILSLVVSNGMAASNADEVTITATADDSEPLANAGADQLSAQDCTTLTLDCSESSDPDSDPLTYFWSVQGKPSGSAVTDATFSDRTAASPTFYPDVAGNYVLSCAVHDGTNWSVPDTMNITAGERATNTRPVVNAGADQAVDAGSANCEEDGYVYDCDDCSDQTVNLGADAAISDPDGDPIVMEWSVEDGDATIADASSLATTVLLTDAAPTEPNECEDVTYSFKLTVTDCTGAVTTDSVRFTSTCCGVEDTASSVR